MTEIQQNRYDQLIRRVNNIVAPGSMVGDALNELFPTIDVERVPGELLFLMGTDICVGSSELLGDAGEVPNIQLFNPAGSGKLITITSIIVSTNATGRVRMATTIIPASSGIATQVFRDRRHGITQRPVGEIRQQSQIALVDANIFVAVIVNESYTMSDENGIAVLSPGSGFEAAPIITASILRITYFWRERVAEPAELNF